VIKDERIMSQTSTTSQRRRSRANQEGDRALSRRQILGAAAAGGGLLGLAACRRHPDAVAASRPGKALNAKEMALCAAACDRVFPADEDPGAVQLGVVDYIDNRLARTDKRSVRARRRFTHGLGLLSDWALAHGNKDFLALDADAQDVTLASLAAEGGDDGYAFVRQLVLLTMEGVFADPSYGGNKDRGGWKIAGFDAPCPNPRCH
jgi:gluconate 2-dehydrogenase gamma chain